MAGAWSTIEGPPRAGSNMRWSGVIPSPVVVTTIRAGSGAPRAPPGSPLVGRDRQIGVVGPQVRGADQDRVGFGAQGQHPPEVLAVAGHHELAVPEPGRRVDLAVDGRGEVHQDAWTVLRLRRGHRKATTTAARISPNETR